MRTSKYFNIKNADLMVQTGIKNDKFKEATLKSAIEEVMSLVEKLQDTEEYDKDIYYLSNKEHALIILKEINDRIKE